MKNNIPLLVMLFLMLFSAETSAFEVLENGWRLEFADTLTAYTPGAGLLSSFQAPSDRSFFRWQEQSSAFQHSA